MTKLPLILYVVLPIFAGLAYYVLPLRKFDKWLLFFQGLLLISLLAYYEMIVEHGNWIDNLSTYSPPVGMTLRLDGLSYLLLTLNIFLFSIMLILSLRKDYFNKLFVFLFLAMEGVINGIFLSTDLFNVYLLIEVGTIIVSILIMFKKDGRSLYDGILYLIVNMVGMAFFLMGVAYVYKLTGVMDFQSVHAVLIHVPKKHLILPFAFLMTGASMKAAFMPLFSWLPKAHGTASAPSVVSAILSGIFVKTGIYLFIRLSFMFSPMIDLSGAFQWVALLTILLGTIFAIVQYDIKLILAYSTVAQVGLIMMGLNYFQGTGYYGALFHIINHGLYKSMLFILAGILIEVYGTRDIRLMKGLWYKSRFLSLMILVASLSITGFPFLATGMTKYMISIYYSGVINRFMFWIISLGTLTYMSKFLWILFSKSKEGQPFKVELNNKIGLFLMAILMLLMGLTIKPISESMFGYQISWSIAIQLQKTVEYIIILIIALILTNQSPLGKVTEVLRKVDLSFNTINMAILGYFMILVAVLSI